MTITTGPPRSGRCEAGSATSARHLPRSRRPRARRPGSARFRATGSGRMLGLSGRAPHRRAMGHTDSVTIPATTSAVRSGIRHVRRAPAGSSIQPRPSTMGSTTRSWTSAAPRTQVAHEPRPAQSLVAEHPEHGDAEHDPADADHEPGQRPGAQVGLVVGAALAGSVPALIGPPPRRPTWSAARRGGWGRSGGAVRRGRRAAARRRSRAPAGNADPGAARSLTSELAVAATDLCGAHHDVARRQARPRQHGGEGHAGPVGLGAPALDARDRQPLGPLRQRAQLVQRELGQGRARPGDRPGGSRRPMASSVVPAAAAVRFTGRPCGPMSGRRGASRVRRRRNGTVWPAVVRVTSAAAPPTATNSPRRVSSPGSGGTWPPVSVRRAATRRTIGSLERQVDQRRAQHQPCGPPVAHREEELPRVPAGDVRRAGGEQEQRAADERAAPPAVPSRAPVRAPRAGAAAAATPRRASRAAAGSRRAR